VPISRIDGGYCEANERVDLRRGKVVWVRPEDIEANELGGATRPLAEEFSSRKEFRCRSQSYGEAGLHELAPLARRSLTPAGVLQRESTRKRW